MSVSVNFKDNKLTIVGLNICIALQEIYVDELLDSPPAGISVIAVKSSHVLHQESK